MKTNLKITGEMVIEGDDLLKILKDHALKNPNQLLPIVSNYMLEHFGYSAKSLQYDKTNLDKIVATIDSTLDGGAKRFITDPKVVERTTNQGFNRKWVGFAEAVGEIIAHQKKRGKHFISWEDLQEELKSVDDGKGKQRFVGVENELSRVKQYLSPSQMVRTPELKGIKRHENKQGLKF